nr:MAG TPA: hypothetical protein [Caudoviricetes sp.]
MFPSNHLQYIIAYYNYQAIFMLMHTIKEQTLCVVCPSNHILFSVSLLLIGYGLSP